MSWRRIRGVILQNFLVMRHSPIRIMEVLYWPLLEVVLWGFITRYLLSIDASIKGGVAVLLGAVVLWDLMFRSQQELSVTYLIDMWDRNVINLHASPLRQSEYVAGGMIFSLGRVLVGTTVLVVVALLAFDFNLFNAGAVLLPSLLILMVMGWALGLFIRAMVMRFGSNAEVLVWSLAFGLQPVSAVFYPVASLPSPLQAVAHGIPAAHVFEALRAFFSSGEVLGSRLWLAAGLDVLYLGVAALVAAKMYNNVRRLGILARPGY